MTLFFLHNRWLAQHPAADLAPTLDLRASWLVLRQLEKHMGVEAKRTGEMQGLLFWRLWTRLRNNSMMPVWKAICNMTLTWGGTLPMVQILLLHEILKWLETTLNLGKTKEQHILNGFPTGLGHWTLLNKNFWELLYTHEKLESTFTADMLQCLFGINIQFNKSFSKTPRPTRRRICKTKTWQEVGWITSKSQEWDWPKQTATIMG